MHNTHHRAEQPAQMRDMRCTLCGVINVSMVVRQTLAEHLYIFTQLVTCLLRRLYVVSAHRDVAMIRVRTCA